MLGIVPVLGAAARVVHGGTGGHAHATCEGGVQVAVLAVPEEGSQEVGW